MAVCLFVCLSVRLCEHIYFCIPCLFVDLFVCLSVCANTSISASHVCLSICLSVCPSEQTHQFLTPPTPEGRGECRRRRQFRESLRDMFIWYNLNIRYVSRLKTLLWFPTTHTWSILYLNDFVCLHAVSTEHATSFHKVLSVLVQVVSNMHVSTYLIRSVKIMGSSMWKN